MRPIILSSLFIIFLFVSCLDLYVADGAITEFEQKRAELLSKMISRQLEKHHYQHRPIDDELSKEIFNSYLYQLDPGKRYFLKSDIQLLGGYSLQMGSQIQAGSLEFPLLAEEFLRRRVQRTREILEEIAEEGIDFHQDKVLQTDSRKLDYCQTEQELKERWHKEITYESILEYLELMEVRELPRQALTSGAEPTNEDIPGRVSKKQEQIRKAAIEKVLQDNMMKLQEIMDRNIQAQMNRYFATIVRAFDPQSAYMPPRKHEDFTIDLRGSFEGIGATLEKLDDEIKVVKVLDGGAAERQKQLQAGDSILKVGQEEAEPIDTRGMELRDVIDLIRGKKGTEVSLTVKKNDGSIQVIPITRDIVQLKDKFVQTTPLLDPDNNKFYGYMKIPSFYRDLEKSGHGVKARNVSDDVRNGLEELKAYGIQGLVLDLRDNPGGANIDATHVGGLFMQYGPIQQTKQSDGKIKSSYDLDRATLYIGPMVVLVNEYTASSAEVLAGAMQDLKRALIVGGSHTYGKGTAQKLINLDHISSLDGVDLSPFKPLGLLKVTTNAVFRINGDPIQQRGILPDIVLPTPQIMSTSIESHYENAMQLDSIDPINTEMLQRTLGFPEIDLEALRQANRKRVVEDKFFQNLMKISEEAEEYHSQTEVVLNVDQIGEQRRRLREINSSRKILWGYDHTGHGDKVSSSSRNGLQGIDLKEFRAKKLQSDPYIKESLSLLKDMEM